MEKTCVVCGAPAVTEWMEYDKPSVWTCDKHYPEDGNYLRAEDKYKFQGEFISTGAGINKQQWKWYSICSGHDKRADGTYIRPDPECGRCMIGTYFKVVK